MNAGFYRTPGIAGMVGRPPVVDHAPPTEELVGRIVLDGPFNLAVGEVIEPLQEEGTKVDA